MVAGDIMAVNEELNMAKKKLFEKLENTTHYCFLMKQWFSMKMTKEEFDAEVRRSMTSEQMHLHNEFLIAMFKKCNFGADCSRNRIAKRAKLAKQKRLIDKNTFQAADPVNYLPHLESPSNRLQDELPLRFSAQELFLPNQALIKGRLLLGSWEQGLEYAEDAAADIIVIAVQYFLKNILSVVFSQRSGYQLKGNKLIHSMGTSVPNPWLRNFPTQHKSDSHFRGSSDASENGQNADTEIIEDDLERLSEGGYSHIKEEADHEKIYRKACSIPNIDPPPKLPVSTNDLIQALLVHRSCVPAHSVYAINVEKMFAALYHPSYEELDATFQL